MDHFEDLCLSYVSITYYVPDAIADVWITSRNMGLGLMELIF